MASPPRPASEPELLRPPLQTRSRESLERVLAAGESLLEEKGWEGFTVQEVSRRANVSIGSIYARAPSKESLILAVYDRAMEEISAEQRSLEDDSKWEGVEARELVKGAVREMAGVMLRHDKILSVFMNRAPVDPVIRERGNEQVKALAARWEELLLRHRREFTHSDPTLAIEVAFRMVFATMARRITRGSSFGAYREVDDERLLEELGRAAAAYLLEPPLRAVGQPA